MLSNCGVGEDSWESLGQQGDQTSNTKRKSTLNVHWKDWCWSWNSNTLVTWCEELTHWKRPWCWERLRAGGEGGNREWTENEMVGWHHRFSGHEFEQTPGDSKGWASLVCCSPWGHKGSDMTWRLNNNNSNYLVLIISDIKWKLCDHKYQYKCVNHYFWVYWVSFE